MSLTHLTSLWDDRKVWALIDTENNGLPIWRQARVLCSIPPGRSTTEWQFVLYTKHDDYRYIVKDKPVEISPISGMKFENIHYDDSIDIMNVDLKARGPIGGAMRDMQLADGHMVTMHPLTAQELQGLRTQLATAVQKNDDLKSEVEERKASETLLQKKLTDQTTQMEWLEDQLRIATMESKVAPRMTTKEQDTLQKDIQALQLDLQREHDRSAQLAAQNEKSKYEIAALTARLPATVTPQRGADDSQIYKTRSEALEKENAALRQLIQSEGGDVWSAAAPNANNHPGLTWQDEGEAVINNRLRGVQSGNVNGITNGNIANDKARDEEINRLKRQLNEMQRENNGLYTQLGKPRVDVEGLKPFATTLLDAPALAGTTKLTCQAPSGCAKGMNVVVGAGATAEMGTIGGFGSIILDRPLDHSHSVGEPVQVFPLGVSPPGFVDTVGRAREEENAKLRKALNDLQAELNEAPAATPAAAPAAVPATAAAGQPAGQAASLPGLADHENTRLRNQVAELEKKNYEMRKYQADAVALEDYKKSSESLQREVYELRIANNKLSGYKTDAERYAAVRVENDALKKKLADLQYLLKDGDSAHLRERLDYYRVQSGTMDNENARLKAQINELQGIINELSMWKDKTESREQKLLSENIELKNRCDMWVYTHPEKTKESDAELARLRGIVNDLQGQLNDSYDYKKRGDLYYARCQALEEELRKRQAQLQAPPQAQPQTGNTQYNLTHINLPDANRDLHLPQTTVFHQYTSYFFSDGVETLPSVPAPTQATRALPTAPPGPLITRLEAPADVGTHKLVCRTPAGSVRGMHVVVGSGTTAEMGTISGFGSLLLEQPVRRAHPTGTVVQVFPLGTVPPGWYILPPPNSMDYSELAMLRKRNVELQDELDALRKKQSEGNLTVIRERGDPSDLDRYRLIIEQMKGELNVEKEKNEDFRYQNMRLRMRVTSLEDMLDARGVFYERPADDYIYRDGTKTNLKAAVAAPLPPSNADNKELTAEIARLQKENDSLLARYKAYRQANETLQTENDSLRRKLTPPSPTEAPTVGFSIWPFQSATPAPTVTPTAPPVGTATLDSPVAAGATKLNVTAPPGTVRGSSVVVGSGSTAEKRTVTGFGSILLDRPLANAHPVGTQISVYQPGVEVPGFPNESASAPAGTAGAGAGAGAGVSVPSTAAASAPAPAAAAARGLALPEAPAVEDIASLQTRVAELEKQVGALATEKNALKQRTFVLQDDLSKAIAAQNSYETQLRMEALVSENAAKQSRIESLTGEIEGLKKKAALVPDVSAPVPAAAPAAAAAAAAAPATAPAPAPAPSADITKLTADVERLKIDNKNLTEFLARARSSLDDPANTTEAKRLAALTAEHQAEVKGLKETMMVYEEGLNAARRENAALTENVKILQKKLVDVAAAGAGAGGSTAGVDNENARLKAQINELQGIINELSMWKDETESREQKLLPVRRANPLPAELRARLNARPPQLFGVPWEKPAPTATATAPAAGTVPAAAPGTPATPGAPDHLELVKRFDRQVSTLEIKVFSYEKKAGIRDAPPPFPSTDPDFPAHLAAHPTALADLIEARAEGLKMRLETLEDRRLAELAALEYEAVVKRRDDIAKAGAVSAAVAAAAGGKAAPTAPTAATLQLQVDHLTSELTKKQVELRASAAGDVAACRGVLSQLEEAVGPVVQENRVLKRQVEGGKVEGGRGQEGGGSWLPSMPSVF